MSISAQLPTIAHLMMALTQALIAAASVVLRGFVYFGLLTLPLLTAQSIYLAKEQVGAIVNLILLGGRLGLYLVLMLASGMLMTFSMVLLCVSWFATSVRTRRRLMLLPGIAALGYVASYATIPLVAHYDLGRSAETAVYMLLSFVALESLSLFQLAKISSSKSNALAASLFIIAFLPALPVLLENEAFIYLGNFATSGILAVASVLAALNFDRQKTLTRS